MKIRKGFVSNSSSSSFLIVGTTSETIIKEVATKMGKYDVTEDEFNIDLDYGCSTEEFFNFYGSYEPNYIGIDVSKKIKTTSFEDLRKEFKDILMNNYNIDISLSDIDLHFGESGEG